MTADLVTIAVLPDAAQANLARTRLSEIGIPAYRSRPNQRPPDQRRKRTDG